MLKKNKGSLTVEACISVTIFLMVFITILYIMRIVFAYGLVQHALNQTAKEFSTYSYYVAVSGLGDINGQIHSSTAEGKESFNTNVSNLVNVYDSFSQLGDGIQSTTNNVSSGNIEGTINSVKGLGNDVNEFKNSLGPAADTIKSIASDPVAAIKSVGSVLVSGGSEATKSFLCGELSRALMAKYISEGGYDMANTRMVNLRVVGGLDGIDFSSSSFWGPDAPNDIELVACYTIDPIFPIDVIKELHFMNKVRVRGWSAKSIF